MNISYDELYELVSKGYDNNELSRILDVNTSRVNKILKEHGINRSAIFNKNRKNSQYWDNDKIELTEKDSTFFSIFNSNDIDDILFK